MPALITRNWVVLNAAGSRIALDYFQPKSTTSPPDLTLFEVLDEGGIRRGETMRTLLDAEDMAEILLSAGFRVVEDLSATEIRQRYLAQRSDGLDIPGFRSLTEVVGHGPPRASARTVITTSVVAFQRYITKV